MAGQDITSAKKVNLLRPLGLRRWNANQFIVVDAVLGIYAINFEAGDLLLLNSPSAHTQITGTHEQLLTAQASVVDGKRILFPDDFDFIDADTIIFSDATTKRGFPQFMLSLLEHAGDGKRGKLAHQTSLRMLLHSGRVLQLKLSTGEVKSLIDGLEFANG